MTGGSGRAKPPNGSISYPLARLGHTLKDCGDLGYWSGVLQAEEHWNTELARLARLGSAGCDHGGIDIWTGAPSVSLFR
jgi:hypothetical protein